MAATAVFFQIYIPTGTGGSASILPIRSLSLARAFRPASHRQGLAGLADSRMPGIWIAPLGGHSAVHPSRLGVVRLDRLGLHQQRARLAGAALLRRDRCADHPPGAAARLEFLLKTLAASGAAIALLDIGIAVAARLGIDLVRRPRRSQDFRVVAESNAFAFMLVLVLAALQSLCASHCGQRGTDGGGAGGSGSPARARASWRSPSLSPRHCCWAWRCGRC